MDAHELITSPIAHMPPARLLDGLSSEQAGLRVSRAPHTIVEILAHMVFWQSWFLDRCEGSGPPPASKASLGWPAADSGRWEPLREEFLQGLERALKLALEESSRARRVDPPLENPPLANYTLMDAIEHVAIHNAHHLGQVVTLRQIMGAWPPPQGSWTW
jgi:uncharacterized damage-inducible protein DinB